MVRLDLQLIADARSHIDAANIHHVKEMIFAYEQAVDLHNRQWPNHEIYHIECEMVLRNYLVERRTSGAGSARLRFAAIGNEHKMARGI